MVSFDAPVASKGEISDSKVGDFIEDDKMGPEEEVMQASLEEDVETLLATLTEKERDIIILRFGLHDTTPMSLKEIGVLYGLTKERIRQIEKRAIEKMKMPARYRLIESYKIA